MIEFRLLFLIRIFQPHGMQNLYAFDLERFHNKMAPQTSQKSLEKHTGQVYIYKGCEALSKSSQVASKFSNCSM